MNNLKADVNAVRGVLINEGKVLCIKNKVDRINYFDLPGGQIEPGESKGRSMYKRIYGRNWSENRFSRV